ncbi:hypothetical protein B484DRAFT_453049, partial [Ochromonadaceae sp. CCMP2298]
TATTASSSPVSPSATDAPAPASASASASASANAGTGTATGTVMAGTVMGMQADDTPIQTHNIIPPPQPPFPTALPPPARRSVSDIVADINQSELGRSGSEYAFSECEVSEHGSRLSGASDYCTAEAGVRSARRGSKASIASNNSWDDLGDMLSGP